MDIKKDCTKYIFRAITTTRNISILRICDKHLSYTRERENIIEGLRNIGIKHKRIGVHSLRSGGATAATNVGVENSIFKKHGRFKSEKIKGSYIHKNLPNKLTVTKSVGLQFSRAYSNVHIETTPLLTICVVLSGPFLAVYCVR